LSYDRRPDFAQRTTLDRANPAAIAVAIMGNRNGAGQAALRHKLAVSRGCANACILHGHNHAIAGSKILPIDDLKSFWGVLGCACWAV
jgi:hypothetical protein